MCIHLLLCQIARALYACYAMLSSCLLPFVPPSFSEARLLLLFSQLGYWTSVSFVMSPPGVDALTGVAAIATGGSHTCALMLTGGMRCWGRNEYGQASAAITVFVRFPSSRLNLPCQTASAKVCVRYRFVCVCVCVCMCACACAAW
jgi:hypothetical protein